MSDKENQYVIREEELTQLIKDSQKLNALERGGVYKWEWYDEAMENYDDDEAADLSSYKLFTGKKGLL